MIRLNIVFSLIFFVQSISLSAQIGINTDSPLSSSVLHIDAAANNSIGGAGVNNDDILVNSQGNIGIGTVTPTAKLDVRGKVTINDGTAETSYVLTSDVAGNTIWKSRGLSNKLGIWNIEKNTPTNISTTASLLTGTTAFTQNDIGLVNGINSVTVLKGKYLMFFGGDLEANEFGYLILKDSNGDILTKIFYYDTLSGSSAVLNFDETTTIQLWYQHIQTNIAAINYTGSTASSYTTPKYYYNVTFLQLK